MNRNRTRILRWTMFSLMIAALALMVGCDKDDDDLKPAPEPLKTAEYSAEIANVWIQQCRQMVATGGVTPPVAARMYGYLGQTIYESVVYGMPGYISLYGQINGMPQIPAANPDLEYHWPSAVNKGSLEILTYLFANANPDLLAQATALYNDMHATYAATVSADVLTRSEGYGQLVASIIRVCADQDGYATHHNCAYTVPVGEGLWESTPPGNVATPLEPCWGENRPFVLTDAGTQCFPPAPPAYSEDPTSAFWAEMMEVYNTVQDSTPEEQAIARFWADGPGTSTPPGHWLNITNIVLNQTNGNLAQAAEIYCKVGIAVNDAFISCWRAKYEYNYIRPVTVIQRLVDGASGWLPPVTTPPFPECTSGHSTQGGAAYKVLEDFFGDVTFVDSTANSPTNPARTFNRFEDAAWDAAYSRLYGGIHFRTACESGVTQGECVGEAVKALHFRANS